MLDNDLKREKGGSSKSEGPNPTAFLYPVRFHKIHLFEGKVGGFGQKEATR